jgi:hypothetical protein
MPAGLRTFDASGAPEVILTSRMTRLLGYVDSPKNGSLVEPLLSEGTAFFIPTLDQNGTMYPANFPTIAISGTTVTWNSAAKFYYGTF